MCAKSSPPASMDMDPHTGGPLSTFLYSQLCIHNVPVPADLDLSGRTAIITGGTSGIGLETARTLLSHGIKRLIITARDEKKGNVTLETLHTEYPHSNVAVWSLDLDSYDSIRAFVEQCGTLDRIDSIILNAGVAVFKFETNDATKHETHFQVNYLSTAYLSLELLPVLKAKKPPGSPARLTIVTSGLVYTAQFSERTAKPLFEAFDDPKLFSIDRYGTTKLLELVLLLKAKEFVSPDEVVINAVDPGFIGGLGSTTGLHRWLPAPVRAGFAVLKIIAGRSLRAGASTYVTAAFVLGRETHGSFVYDWRIAAFPPLLHGAEGEELMDQLWTETLEELRPEGLRIFD